MESEITIKASKAEMRKFFEENSVCSVRYFEPNGNGTYRARVRHAERKRYLYGTFTIPQLIKRLGGRATLELTDEMTERNDTIDNAVYACILALAEKDEDELPWNMEIIGAVTDAIKDVLSKHDIKVRHPGVVTDNDGAQHYED